METREDIKSHVVVRTRSSAEAIVLPVQWGRVGLDFFLIRFALLAPQKFLKPSTTRRSKVSLVCSACLEWDQWRLFEAVDVPPLEDMLRSQNASS